MHRALALAFLLLAACGSKSNPAPSNGSGSAPAATCMKGGCSGTVCAENANDIVTTCEYKPEYACYTTATCARQPDGKCGWTQTAELTACLANPPPAAGPSPQ